MSFDMDLPKSLDFLLRQRARYKVAYGGRGGGKSWAFARSLIFIAWQKAIRVLCAREFQNSIRESVHALLADQIKELGIEQHFTVQHASIVGRNGSQFSFEGLRYNSEKIKSYEGIDICWIEEANRVSKSSWETLIPTIRKADSEIWVTFNPELETDEAYKRFVTHPPHDAIVRKVNWSDNPWFPEVLRLEMESLKARDEDAYLNIWEGHCRVTLEGAIYATELREATRDGRITRVPYLPEQPVQTFWDLGWSDCTSIWFAQRVGFEYHLIDFYQARLQKLAHYLKVLQDRGYVYGKHYLPHDADNESLGAESIAKTMRRIGHDVVVVPRVADKPSGLKAVREIFPLCWFDETKCDEGLQALRHYRYDIDEHGQWDKMPLHDEASHAADAFEQFARSISRKHDIKQAPGIKIVQYSKGEEALGWMG